MFGGVGSRTLGACAGFHRNVQKNRLVRMTDNRGRVELIEAERSLTPDAATPPLSPVPMPRQVIIFWTPRLIFAETLQVLKVFVLKGLRYRGPAYQRTTITLPINNERR